MEIAAVQAFISGFPNFLIHVGATLALFALAVTVYVALTPHKELELIRNGNPSAALAFGGVVLGLAIPLSACLANALGLIDLMVWGVIILLLQLIAFRVVDMLLKGLPQRIAEGDVAAALTTFAVKIAVAMILAGAVADPSLSFFRSAGLPGLVG